MKYIRPIVKKQQLYVTFTEKGVTTIRKVQQILQRNNYRHKLKL